MPKPSPTEPEQGKQATLDSAGVQSIRQVTGQVQGHTVKAAHRLGSDPVRARVRHHLAIAMKVHTGKKRLRSSLEVSL